MGVVGRLDDKAPHIKHLAEGEDEVKESRKRLKYVSDNFEEIIIAILLTLMSIIVALQLFTRYVMSNPLVWTDEAARFTYMWMASLCLALSTKHRSHLAISFFVTRLLSEKGQLLLDILISILTIGVLVCFVPQSIRYCIFVKPLTTPSLEVSKLIIALCLPVGYGLALIRYISVLLEDVNRFRMIRIEQAES